MQKLAAHPSRLSPTLPSSVPQAVIRVHLPVSLSFSDPSAVSLVLAAICSLAVLTQISGTRFSILCQYPGPLFYSILPQVCTYQGHPLIPLQPFFGPKCPI